MMMAETLAPLPLRRPSNQRKRVKFNRMYEPHLNHYSNGDDDDHQLVNAVITEDQSPTKLIPSINFRPTIHWGPVVEGDSNGKEEINTDTEQFDALFARSNASSPPLSHPRCYSSCSPSNIPSLLIANPSSNLHAKSQPLLSSSPSAKSRHSYDLTPDTSHRGSISSSNTQPSNSSMAQTKRKNFSLTHTAQTFLQAENGPNEQLEPLARSCSYKRPQSMKKYRQKKKEKEKEQQQSLSARKSSTTTSTQNNHISHSTTSDSSRKSVTSPIARISIADLMAADDPQDQWSSPKTRRSERIGSLPLDQLQLPTDGDEEIYLVRQFHTTSKGFVNRGDSFKRSIKRSGSTSRRNSFRANITPNDRTSSTEQEINHSPSSTKELRTSIHSLTNSSAMNLNGIVDSHFLDNNNSSSPSAISRPDDDEDDAPVVERVQNEDGRLQDIRVYQVYLLGMSGTGKCSLIRQFKTTEYRGIYDYSSSIDDDPDNTVSIMLDGIESRLHIINIDIDYSKISVTGDAFVVVYSITDRQSFQTAVQLIKNIRDNELISIQSTIKRHVPIILVGNKSDLVRKRSVTKEIARHAALKYNCKFVETSAAINDKVDDLLAGTLKQIRINEQIRTEEKRRLTMTNCSFDTNDSETPILSSKAHRKSSTIYRRNSTSVFSKFLNVFRKKPSRLPADVENLNTTN